MYNLSSILSSTYSTLRSSPNENRQTAVDRRRRKPRVREEFMTALKTLSLGAAACLGGAFALSSAPAEGVGADQAHRDHRAGRHRRRRRPDGARRARHHHQAQSVEAIGRRHQQVGRRRRRRLSRRQECEGRRSQADHHPVEPVHHPARDRHSLQLEGSHARSR